MTDPVRQEPVPFVMVPVWLLGVASPRAVQVYAVLAGHARADRAPWPSRPTLATWARCHANTVDNAVAELKALGALRVGPRTRANGSQGSNEYVLVTTPPPPSQLTVNLTSEGGAPPSPASQPVGTPEVDVVLEEPSPNGAVAPLAHLTAAGAETANAGRYVKRWIDLCERRPPSRLVGQVARSVGELLREGYEGDDVWNGLQRMHHRALHPSTLPSLVHEFHERKHGTMQGGGAKPSRNSEILGAALRRATEREEAGG